jgi:hypothetical protein
MQFSLFGKLKRAAGDRASVTPTRGPGPSFEADLDPGLRRDT